MFGSRHLTLVLHRIIFIIFEFSIANFMERSMITMATSFSLANRFREVVLNGRWVANTNYHDQLTQIPFEVAVARGVGLNTIAILAQHIHYYIKGIAVVLKGGVLSISDKYSFDFPAFENSLQWHEFLNRFWTDAEELAVYTEHLSDEQLKAVFSDEKYGTYQRNIEAMIEHSYYHLGQIVLIRKVIESQSSVASLKSSND